jgi:hypothetical protein
VGWATVGVYQQEELMKKMIDVWDTLTSSQRDRIFVLLNEYSKKPFNKALLPFVTLQEVAAICRRDMACKLNTVDFAKKQMSELDKAAQPEWKEAITRSYKAIHSDRKILSKIGHLITHKICEDETSRTIWLNDHKLRERFKSRFDLPKFHIINVNGIGDKSHGMSELERIKPFYWKLTASAKALDKVAEYLSDTCG